MRLGSPSLSLLAALLFGAAPACFAQFPLPIPTRPTTFPLQRPSIASGTVVASGLYDAPAGLAGVVQVAAGSFHSLALKSDGTVVAWGDNSYGQAAVPAGLTAVVQVAAGSYHSLALKSDGTVVAWGDNSYGQAAVPAGLTGVVQVAAGSFHSLALKSDGIVVAWGDNSYGQAAVPAGLTGVAQVAAGPFGSVALKDGTVVAWGLYSVPAGLAGVVQVAVGFSHGLALLIDTDGDGLLDGAEVNTHKTDPKKADTDGDGLLDGAEVNKHKTDPKKAETDGDGLLDGAEVNTHKTDPRKSDTDEDGVTDPAEINTHKTDPRKSDTDEDGLKDGSELNTHKTDPKKADTDGDWLEDGAEVNTHKTDPKKADTDGDGLRDGAEISTYKTDPKKADTDGDGLKDGAEINTHETDPKKADTDGDGLRDGAENSTYNTDPKDRDSDGDGLKDGAEVNSHQTDPLVEDTDNDGLDDGAEINSHQTDPLTEDTDGDGLDDDWELQNGTNPVSADSTRDIDGDGLNAQQEIQRGTDPASADTDDDGLRDGVEVNTHKTNPLSGDTDRDGYADGFEILSLKSNPLRPNNEPAFVRVRDPKNPDEDNAGYDVENAGIGYVGDVYEISTTEVTNLMYARFLNSIAKSDFLYGLYTTLMGTDANGGIVRFGSNGSYTYRVKDGFANRPVNFVSVYDVLRYINWLHNGMPKKAAQDSSTTEDGAYKLLGDNPRNVVRNAGAKYFLPDQDEWHKAAFFDPNPGQGRPSDSYWPFADQSTSGPGGNFKPSRINLVATSAGPSHYGTYDQGGNVWEWTETVLENGKRLIAVGNRPRSPMSPAATTRETADLGFRVGKTVAIPFGKPLVTPALVPVAEEFNLGDDTNRRLGAVPQEFNIGTYEVSNAQYAAFLNAVARTDTFYGLYNTRMGTDPQGGIMRRGQNGNFSYAVKPGFAKKPVNFVTIYSAMRFCNWLHNGARRNSETERGAYRLLGNIPSDTVTIRRSPGARFFLPTENEWYKAAFYDPSPTGMPTASYWSYAVKSDKASTQRINFQGAYAGLTDVDKPSSKSFFGTIGQSGNAAEWTETLSANKLARRVYGGHYASSAKGVSALGRLELDPLAQSATVGFRVAATKDWRDSLSGR